MSDEPKEPDVEQYRRERMLELGVDTRKFEIDLFWRRSLFLGLHLGSLRRLRRTIQKGSAGIGAGSCMFWVGVQRRVDIGEQGKQILARELGTKGSQG